VSGFRDTVAQDYHVTDGTEQVTFTAVRESTTTAYTITDADPREVKIGEVAAGGGEFQYGDRLWLLGADQITVSTDRPQRGDRITQGDGTVWELFADATLDGFGISWECPTRRAR
jgi:hypothetical protein